MISKNEHNVQDLELVESFKKIDFLTEQISKYNQDLANALTVSAKLENKAIYTVQQFVGNWTRNLADINSSLYQIKNVLVSFDEKISQFLDLKKGTDIEEDKDIEENESEEHF